MGANYKRTIVLGLDYSEFSGGITECNRKMGLLDAEMKLAQEQAKAYGDASDQLKIKQEGLAQKIELQRKIVEQQAAAYDKAMSAGKKNEKQTDALDKALLNSRTTLQKLENEYKSVTDQIEDFTEETEDAEDGQRSFGDTIRDVADFMGVSASPVVEKLASHFDGLDKNVAAAVFTVGTLTTTLAGLTMKTAEHAKEVVNVSQTMGMTTDQYQVWDYILKSVGYDAESASGDFAALAEKAKDASEGGKDSAETFRQLGISVKNSGGQLKSQNELFTELVFSLMKMEDVTKRNAIASDLLSTTGEKIVPVLNMTKEELFALKDQAYKTGNVMSGETLNGFQDLNEAMTEFHGVTEGLSNTFAVILLPILTALFEAISAIPAPVLQMLITFGTIITTLTLIIKAIDSTVGTWSKFTGSLSAVDAKTIKTTAIIMGVVAALIALAAIIAVIIGRSDDLNRTMESVGQSVGNISKGVQGSTTSYHATGTDYFKGGETWVGEKGPERVILPRGSRILTAEESASSQVNNVFYVTIDAKNVREFNDIVRLAQSEQKSYRAGKVKV